MLFVFVFMFTITFSAIAEETVPLVDSKPAIIDTIKPKSIIKEVKPAIKKIIKKEISDIKSKPEIKKEIFVQLKDLKCVKAAVEKREIAIQTAVDVYSASIKASFEARKNSLLIAWDIAKTKERNVAIKNAFVQQKKAGKDALKIDKKTRLQIWQSFIKERIICKVEPTGEDMNEDVNFNK